MNAYVPMSGFSFSYDIFSIIISALVVVYVIKIRSLGTFRNRVFFVYVLTVLTMCCMDFILVGFRQFFPKAYTTILVLNCIIHTLVFFIPLNFLIYVFSLVDYFQMVSEENKSMLPFKVFFPISIGLCLLWACLLDDKTAPLFSYLDNFGGLPHGLNGYAIELFISLYYLGYGVFTMIQHKYRLEKNSIFLMVIVFFLMVVSIAVQGTYPSIRAMPVVYSLSLMIFSLFVQKPDFLSNGKSEVLNDKAFDIILSDYFTHKYSFKVIIIFMEDAPFYKSILGQNELYEFELCVTRKLRSMFRDTILLKDEVHGLHYLVFKNADNMVIDSAVNAINEQVHDVWGYKGLRFDFTFRICVVDGSSDVSSPNELKNLAYVFTHMPQYKGVCINARELDMFQIQSCNYVEKAIEEGNSQSIFKVVYQPIFSVREKRITRAESLLCFEDNPDVFFTTDSFFPVFEKTGHFFNINAFSFISTCELLSSVDVSTLGLERIGINVSIVDGTQQNLFDQIKNRLEFYKVSPSLIHFEIAQNSLFSFPDVVAKNIQKLSDYGIEIVLDNFGLNNTNIGQFMDLSLGMLKFDSKVINAAWSSSKIGNMLKSVVKISHDMGIHVMANGVESMEQRIWLEGIGCDYLQGNLFSKPLPEEEFLNLLKNQMS